MRKTNDILITEFHKEKLDVYPDINLDQAKEICNAPWLFLKEEMESGELPEVRFKYFGTFQVYKGRAKNMLDNLKERFRFNKVDKKEYFRIKNILDNFLNKKEDDLEK